MSGKSEHIKNILKNIPDLPGIYQFYDKNNKNIYIGKAKKLKKRVSSYFNKNHENYRLQLLIKQIYDIKYTIVKTEHDALLLENNMIKAHQPKYNIQLKDDKTFPWICIKNERFPKVFITRNRIDDGSLYFGPYTSAHMVRTLLNLIRNIYPLRNCNLNLSEGNINQKKFRTCLEYQIENCKGPCEGLQEEKDYNVSIENIKKILKGNLNEVISYLKKVMSEFAKNYLFEEAEKIKIKIEILERFQSKSTVVSKDLKDMDVFSITSNERFAIINYLKIHNGSIIQSHNVEIKKKLNEPDTELLEFGIIDIYQKIESKAKEIIVPLKLENILKNKKFTIPKLGDRKNLLDLSLRNAIQFRKEKENVQEKSKESSPEIRKLKTMKEDLRLVKSPNYIECFDNSNLQGTNAVSSCVVFRNTKPSKSEYRHFNVKTVDGPDDYSTMKEILERRYTRLINEGVQLPDLIIIDGGKGQLSAAYEILKNLNLEKRIPIIGIAKRLEEIYFPNDTVPLYLNKNSETLKVIQYARNEAHRFGISHHRKRRDREMIKSELDEIKGIGLKSKELLLQKFKSVEKIKVLKLEELNEVIGNKKAKIIYDYFKN